MVDGAPKAARHKAGPESILAPKAKLAIQEEAIRRSEKATSKGGYGVENYRMEGNAVTRKHETRQAENLQIAMDHGVPHTHRCT